MIIDYAHICCIFKDYESGERMDIPEEFTSLDAYCATLGHKCMSFLKYNPWLPKSLSRLSSSLSSRK